MSAARFTALLGLCLTALFASAHASHAQDAEYFQHVRPSDEQLRSTAPGKNIKLSVQLLGVKKPDTRLRTLALIDGRMMDVPLATTSYSEADRLVYSADVPAPFERMSYQFFAYGADGSRIEASRKYVLERSCIPVFEGNAAPDVTPLAPSQEEGIGPLVAQNDDLERELDLLTAALKTSAAIEDTLKKRGAQ